ncbi:16S rRNA (uracil(1498)-N(3))-methyltransferase [Streptomyces sp. NBC_01187]|uniref:16S rRNA (uracil(1498)-N(3))-methyltransferase n=1 Tax=Streptomyces sp. NBC_01187 TaxID=2903766 RepID=UPI00386DAE99|nr:16S rRNA (uracil(1498)-N(3))-methyltransferase [Streptomyces sp. NBC_01187]
MTAPVFLTDPGRLTGLAPGDVAWLDGPEGRHAVTVKRMRPGEEIVLADGAGIGVSATVVSVEGKDQLRAEVVTTRTEAEPRPRITVVQALPKGDRGELAVETMTETGVDTVVPWRASRCVTQWKGERGEKALAKWRAAAREAGKQSRRLRFPGIAEPAATSDVGRLLADAAFAGVLHEEASGRLATAPLPSDGDIVLVVGPEGGISPAELAVFEEAGADPYKLGPSVLRTSTAGTAAAAVLLARSGRWS